MPSERHLDNLIIGTGHAGIATAMALRDLGQSFEVVDVGYDVDTHSEAGIARLASTDPAGWDLETAKRLFPPPQASASGVDRRDYFGSDFVYRVPELLSVRYENCAPALTHGLGGFSNVWGAAMLPYGDHALRDWPIPIDALKSSYRNVLRYVPLSAEHDDLAAHFPIYSDAATALRRSASTDALTAALQHRSKSLASDGMQWGRSRLAVDSAGGNASCRYCGKCLEGCAYGSIFNARRLWRVLEAQGTPVHKGYYALEFKEESDHVAVTAVDINSRSIRQWRAKRLYLAAGHFATARLIVRSFGRFNEPIRILDSQYFFFPLLAYRPADASMEFTLADAFVEVANKRTSSEHLHFQLYGPNQIFERTLRSVVPRPLPVGPLLRRFYLIQGFLHSRDSGHLELTIARRKDQGDDMAIRGTQNPASAIVARRAKGLFAQKLRTFGVVPPLYLQLVKVGRSFHTGGSFPMGGVHPVYNSDFLGRPAGLQRVHIADSASFPSIAGSTIAFTIMANADRIVRASRFAEIGR